ncbi:MAG: YqaA family protein [Kiloniellales bacterium]
MRRTVLFARRLSRSRHGQAGLFALSAAETVFLPLVLEAIMAPMMLVDRRRAWRTGVIAVAGCLAGALIAYFVGAWLYDWIGQDLVASAGREEAFEDFKVFMQAHGFWAILVAGLTPIPFQLAVLASGVTGYSLPGFVAAVLIARSIRYLGMAALVAWLGADAFRAFSRLRRIAPWRRTRASGHEVAQAVPEHGEHQSRRAQDAPAGEGRVG